MTNEKVLYVHENVKKNMMSELSAVIKRDWQLYLLCLPALLYVLIFNYFPMYGVQLAFKHFVARSGITGSEWVGFEHFARFFRSPQFLPLIRNTLSLSFYQLFAGFPLPVIFALLLNQVNKRKFGKIVQTVIYAPHFISEVVMCGMILVFLSPSSGIINTLLDVIGLDKIFFMGNADMFPNVYVWSGIWQQTGWGTIIYIAALSAISPEMYEAAKIDGASKWKTILYIDLPSILPTVVIMFVLQVGRFMSVGFQKAYLLQNPMNLARSEIISTYVYKMGLLNAQYDYSTAINLFNNLINIVLLISVNKISKKLTDSSLW